MFHTSRRMRRNFAPLCFGFLLVATCGINGAIFDRDSMRASDSDSQSGRFGSGGGRVSGNVNNGGSRRGTGDLSVTGGDNRDRFAPTEENFNRLTTQDPRFDRDGSGDRGTSDLIANRGDRFTGSGGSGDRNTGSGSSGDRFTGSGTDRERFTGSGTDRDRLTGSGSSGDRFTGSAGDRDRLTGTGSSGDRFTGTESDRFNGGSGNSRGSSFPPNYRIDVDFVRLENKGGILASGKSCDVLSSCDTKLYGDIDLTGAGWPKDPAYQKWLVVFSVTNNNSPTIGKTLQKDVCQVRDQGTSSQGVARVRVVDEDSITQEDDMGKFDCQFSLRPADVASSAASAQWGPEFECTGSTQVGKIRLFARQRAYEISTSNCNALRQSVVSTAKA